jgi:glutamate carboxypeptidase
MLFNIDDLKPLDSELELMLSAITTWANVNSGSWNVAGVTSVAEMLTQDFVKLDCQVTKYDLPKYKIVGMDGQEEEIPIGPLMKFTKRPDAAIQILLAGHIDTVFPETSLFQTVTQLRSNRLVGPGVVDMKGGLAIMLWALRQLERNKLAHNIGWTVVLTPDEEIGSIASGPVLTKLAKDFDLGLLYEPALDHNGTFAGARNGSGKFTIIAHGQAAHVGRDFAKGSNAIVAMAELLQKIVALNTKRKHIMINIGTISGGSAVNVVADICVCKLDIRLPTEADKLWLHEQLGLLTAKAISGVRFEISGGFYRPAKLLDNKQLQLFNFVKKLGLDLQQQINWQDTGGCCDGNNLASVGLRNIDTLGALGGGMHSDQEYLLINSLVPRAKLTLAILLAIANSGLPW